MNESLAQYLRRIRGQSTVSPYAVLDKNNTLKGIPKERKKKKTVRGSSYDLFLHKYSDMENNIEQFNTQDCVYFFREKARESGVKYVIANMQRDMGIFKRLQENFSIMEILLMIEFIFSGEQTYLDITRTQPTVLTSNWVNTIYQDSLDWSNDCYVDKKLQQNKSKREWNTTKNKKTKVGEWE